jgi:hypothetical protein
MAMLWCGLVGWVRELSLEGRCAEADLRLYVRLR